MSQSRDPRGAGSVIDVRAAEPGAPTKLFARQATGLVRAVPQRASLIFNFIPSHPAFVLSAGVFFAFSLFPGGNFFLALVLDIPLVLAFAYAYGLLASMLPRTGGDYMFVTRMLHPLVGVISSVCWMAALFLSNAFFASAFINVGLAPGLKAIGLVGNSDTVVSWGETLATDTTWQFIVGIIMFLIAAGFIAGGWRFTLRAQAVTFAITAIGIVVAGVIALVTTHASFITDFNSFAAPFTKAADSYHATIASAQAEGFDTSPPFSLTNTVPLLGILAISTIYPFISSAYSGELRQARSLRTANTMGLAGIAALATIGIFGAIFLNTFGTGFTIAANSSVGLPEQISATPTYFFLLAVSKGSVVLAIFLVFTYVVYWPLNTYANMMQQSRILFAWAFDTLLPSGVTRVSRTRSPYVALTLTVLVSIGALYWSLHSATFLTVIVYGTLLALITMMLVGLSAAVAPWRRPEFYRAGATQKKILGVPVVTIAGVASILSGLFIYALYLHYPEFGLADKTNAAEWVGGTVVVGALFYLVVRWLRRRQGVRLELAYSEIPPE